MKKNKRFWLIVALCAVPFIGDALVARSYFYARCFYDGGVHIYKVVSLSEEYWNKNGGPAFYTERGDFDNKYFNGEYEIKGPIKDTNDLDILYVRRSLHQVIHVPTGQVMGETVKYIYKGGWAVNNLQPFEVVNTVCPKFSDYPKGSSGFKDNPNTDAKDPRMFRIFHSYIFLKHDMESDK